MNIRARFAFHFFMFLFLCLSGHGQINHLSTSSNLRSSILSSGDIYKLSISGDEDNTGSGIYKIDFNMLLGMGINPQGLDPRKIKLFGNGGGMLPQKNSAPRADDLLENSIYISGEIDGSFDPTDYILFYAQGPHTWTFDSLAQTFYHTFNIYSDNSFYFLLIGDAKSSNGRRVFDQPGLQGGIPVTDFDEHIFHESDKINVIQSGRDWYGETFSASSLSQDFLFQTPGIVSDSPIKITSSLVGRSTQKSGFDLLLNGTLLGTQNFSTFISSTSSYGPIGDLNTKTYSANAGISPASTLNIGLTYNLGSVSEAIGHLNFLEINYKKILALYGNQTSFRASASKQNSISEFIINTTAQDLKVWDVTDLTSVNNQVMTLNATKATFSAVTSSLKEFIVFSGNNFPAPVFVEKTRNQNLHSLDVGNIPDMVIVTVDQFKPAANRLAKFRKTNDNMEVRVVDVNEIYNEFSSGAQDITAIRDFVRMIYERESGVDSLKYLLLLGACSYDYKNRISANTNLIPVYESRQSLNNVDTYSSDDYFGFLDPSEGYWSEVPLQDHLLDIGIGRLPAKSVSEAEGLVNKLINYSSNRACLGKWRDKIVFVADDGDFNGHLSDAESLSQIVKTNYPEFNINKLYIDAYPQESTSGGETSSIVKNAINSEIEKGILILNYSGHGSETILSQEKIIEISQINNWKNYNRLPFFITATCEFGRYDDPARPSGAEASIMNPNGGTIGLLTSTRPVYKSSNVVINSNFYRYAFKKVAGQLPRLGYIMRQAKNKSQLGVGNRNYALLGDPSLRLTYPEREIVITHINDRLLTSVADTLQALEKISISGEVRNNGTKVPDFNGTVYLSLYDKETRLKTLGTEGSSPVNFNLRNNFIYDGFGSVINGIFKITFIVPKDIAYQYGYGKISIYASDSLSLLDAVGQHSNIIIGGTSKTASVDLKPPSIKLFIGDTLFTSGGFAERDTKLIAYLQDENGINMSNTIGHEISAKIDNGKELIILNEFYSPENNFKNGTIDYPLKNLTPGNHTIKLKAWDTYDNSSETTISFVVIEKEKLGLSHVLNYPNPFTNKTNFQFDHSRKGDDLEVLIQIFSVSGKLVKTLKNQFFTSLTHISGIHWDGKDEFGDNIDKGIYLYKVKVRSLTDLTENFAYQKLVILD